jgi:hypothetical protein
MGVRIWLDDERNFEIFNEPGRALDVLQKHGRDNWIWVKNIEDAQKLLVENDVDVLSCDNDLGPEPIKQGYLLLNWLEEMAFTNPKFNIPNNIYFHSSNSARYLSATQTINNIKKIRGNK